MANKKLSSRRGTPWYRHRDAWAGRYRKEIRFMRIATHCRQWMVTIHDCEEMMKSLRALRAAKCST